MRVSVPEVGERGDGGERGDVQPYVLDLSGVDRTRITDVGGKGAHLGELLRIDGVRVPAGFCVSTHAFRRVLAEARPIGDLLDQLSRLDPDDREAVRTLSAAIRGSIEAAAIPGDVAAAITGALARFGERDGYAVRSSATAEDLPAASFAGQQDTYLNVVGPAAILAHIRRCWASLFTERAVTYRRRNGIDHRKVNMAVVVQRMVFAQAAGVLFTADPVTSNRKVACVEAGFGLGDALVSGLVNPDVFTVRDGEIVARTVAAKKSAVHAAPAGGTRVSPIDRRRQQRPALTDAQVLRLVRLGRRIEGHFGHPQDIEWCLVDDDFHIVQSRPITTLFPAPTPRDGGGRAGAGSRVYVCVGHQQMMTDPMKPLGLSVFQLTAARPMYEAGGRLFVDITDGLASPASRAGLLEVMGRGDPLIGDALRTVLDRGDLIPPVPDGDPGVPAARGAGAAIDADAPIDTDPAIVAELIRRTDVSIAAMKREIRAESGPALFDFILADIQELKRVLFDPRSFQALMAGMRAIWWLNDQLREWLGEKNAADTLIQSVPHNVTSEMGLALLDVADAIRPHPDVVAFLRRVEAGGLADEGGGFPDEGGGFPDEGGGFPDEGGGFPDGGDRFLDRLEKLAGGRKARDAIETWLDRYGMRCVGEIDITRPRWRERPATLVPLILGNIRNFEPGESVRRFERGRQQAWQKQRELLERLRALPDGRRKAEQTKRMIDRARTFTGYREYPKYGIVSRYLVYKQALLAEAGRLARAGVLRNRDDVFQLTFAEFHEVARTNRVDDQLIRRREEAFRSYHALTPPRVITSDGEVITGSYRRDDVPAGALAGLAVSAGTVEGRARVILDMARAGVEPGDILVTTHTDPSWTPLFVAVAGLVTEVGGLMTHGAVIAREYGLPAVVGVLDATRLIRDGQRIRVHGTDGYVEILS